MTQSLARELGKHNINVNAVCPGAVDTSRMDVVRDNWDQMAAATPIGRNGTDKEVGDFVLICVPRLLLGFMVNPLIKMVVQLWNTKKY